MSSLIRSWFSRRPPWTVMLVVLMTAAAAIYQLPHYRVPPEHQTAFYAIVVSFVVLLILGIYAGARWAFVLDVATVWIFPLETLLEIKPLFRGTVLSLLHIAAVALLFVSWRYFWRKRDMPSPRSYSP